MVDEMLTCMGHQATICLQVVQDFEEGYPMLRLLAASPESQQGEGSRSSVEQNRAKQPQLSAIGNAAASSSSTASAKLLALKLRASQKQVLWDGLQAMIMDQKPE